MILDVTGIERRTDLKAIQSRQHPHRPRQSHSSALQCINARSLSTVISHTTTFLEKTRSANAIGFYLFGFLFSSVLCIPRLLQLNGNVFGGKTDMGLCTETLLAPNANTSKTLCPVTVRNLTRHLPASTSCRYDVTGRMETSDEKSLRKDGHKVFEKGREE